MNLLTEHRYFTNKKPQICLNTKTINIKKILIGNFIILNNYRDFQNNKDYVLYYN